MTDQSSPVRCSFCHRDAARPDGDVDTICFAHTEPGRVVEGHHMPKDRTVIHFPVCPSCFEDAFLGFDRLVCLRRPFPTPEALVSATYESEVDE